MKQQLSRRGFLKAAAGTAMTVVIFRVEAADATGKAKTYAYVIDANKCIGCGSCGRACERENNVPEGNYRTWIERYVITKDGQVHVESPDGGKHGFSPSPVPEDQVSRAFFVPKMCNHCASPPCVQVCPVGATFQTRDGAVLVDKEHCVGCAYCIQACPYSARFMNMTTHTADKCTWCYHRVTKNLPPACVHVCPSGARRFGEVYEGSEMHKFLLEARLTVLAGDLGTEPRVHYAGLSGEVH